MGTKGTERLENISKITHVPNWECGGAGLRVRPSGSGHPAPLLSHPPAGSRGSGRLVHRPRGWERETPIGCHSYTPRLGSEHATQAGALMGNQTSDLLLYGVTPNPMSQTSQVHRVAIFKELLCLTF